MGHSHPARHGVREPTTGRRNVPQLSQLARKPWRSSARVQHVHVHRALRRFTAARSEGDRQGAEGPTTSHPMGQRLSTGARHGARHGTLAGRGVPSGGAIPRLPSGGRRSQAEPRPSCGSGHRSPPPTELPHTQLPQLPIGHSGHR
jgi:hypothetical protein